jgi:toxin-antitoxin system PIN domain toxin
MRALLDVNVLLALMDKDSVHHGAALAWWRNERGKGWASCPLTQNGFARIACQGRYPLRPTAAQAIILLRMQLGQTSHEFWPDDISIADDTLFDSTRILGPKQITDVYLLALAVKKGGRLVTFDRSISPAAVRGAKPRDLVML